MAAIPLLKNSTNVRSVERDPAFHAWAVQAAEAVGQSFTAREAKAPWAIRAAMRALTAISPDLASAWAARLFCTPPRRSAPADERAALASARAGAVVVAGQRIQTWTWGEGPPVLLVHGWGGRGGQLHRFVPGLLARGLSVVTFDGPGHGASDGRLGSLVELGRAARGVADALPAPLHGLVAHSMGGAATAFALSQGLSAQSAVFIAPPSTAVRWVGVVARALDLKEEVRDGMVARVEARLGVPIGALTMDRLGPIQRTPLLVIHDAQDREVPHASGVEVVSRWPGARLHTTRGLGHTRVLADPDVIALATGFVGEGSLA